jgi:acetyl-CoA acetyltransferase family protein
MKEKRVAIIDYCRTPFLRSGTGYSDLMAWQIGRHAVKGLMARAGVDASMIDHIIMGCVATDIATTNVAREIGLGAGLPERIPAHTCTVACISANMAATTGADMIVNGHADAVIAGGVESFSDPDIKISKAYRKFITDMTMFKKPKTLGGKLKLLRRMKLKDFVLPERPAIGEYSTGMSMVHAAERLARKMGISQEDQDKYAILSHHRAADATKAGILRREIVPVVANGSSKPITEDNGFRGDATLEKLSKLKGAVDRKYGTVTAANSSFLTDGGSAVLLMSEEKAKKLGLKPKAYLKSYIYTGQDLWDELLLGPAVAIPQILRHMKMKLSDIGVFEIHEAFAAQMLGVMRCLESEYLSRKVLGLEGKAGKLRIEKVNVHGGSLSIGHPFGATGGRLIGACCRRLIDEGERFGLIAGCAAGAVGSAMLFENAMR